MAKTVVSQEALRQALVNIDDLFVRKDGAKVLSTHDFTTAYKNKLDGLDSFTLSPATASALGGIIVGAGLAIANDGTLSLDTLAINDIVGLADAIAAKASASDLATLSAAVNDASTGLATRASAADVTVLNNQVNNVTTGLNQRVLQTVYAADMATKASAADLTTLSNKVNDVSTGLDTKVASATYNAKVTELETSIGNKVASSTLFDGNNLVKSDLLPSFVDDVIEGYYDSTAGKFYSDSTYTTEITGEQSKIYVDKVSNCSYRYGGSTYVLITSADIELMSQYNVNSVFNDVFHTSLATSEYSVLLELTVPTLEDNDGIYMGRVQLSSLTDAQRTAVERLAEESCSLFFNSTDTPMQREEIPSSVITYYYISGGETPITADHFDAISIVYDSGSIDSIMIQSKEDISGDTVEYIIHNV